MLIGYELTGCATLVKGTTQPVTFNSNPEGASVKVNGVEVGKTPVTVVLKKQGWKNVVISKEGYASATLPLTNSMDPWFLGNILLGGFIGSSTDIVSGAGFEMYSPDSYVVTLSAESASAIDRNVSFSDSQKAKNFIINSYNSILSDLSKGNGEYLNTLLVLLKVTSQKSTIEKIKAFSVIYPNIVDFADHTVDFYLPQQ